MPFLNPSLTTIALSEHDKTCHGHKHSHRIYPTADSQNALAVDQPTWSKHWRDHKTIIKTTAIANRRFCELNAAPFLLFWSIWLASFNVTPCGATISSSSFVITWSNKQANNKLNNIILHKIFIFISRSCTPVPIISEGFLTIMFTCYDLVVS